MKHIIAFLLSLLSSLAALAQSPPPSCWVINGATGYTMGDTPDGRFAAWWCPTAWSWSRTLLVSKNDYVLKHPTGLPPNASPVDVAIAYWNTNVASSCGSANTTDPAMLRLCDAAFNASLTTNPPSRWIVSPYTGATYRATYQTSAAINGVRTKTASGRVLILTDGAPTPCECEAGRVVETTSAGASATYCAVAASAPQVVATCRLR